MNVGTVVIYTGGVAPMVGFVYATHDSWVEDYSPYIEQPDAGKVALAVISWDGGLQFPNNQVEGTGFYVPSVKIEAV